MTERICISARVDPATVEALAALSHATDRNKSWHIAKAVEAYIAQQGTIQRKGDRA